MKIEEKTNFFEKKSILDEIWKSAKKCQKIDIFFKKKLNFICIEFHFYKSWNNSEVRFEKLRVHCLRFWSFKHAKIIIPHFGAV